MSYQITERITASKYDNYCGHVVECLHYVKGHTEGQKPERPTLILFRTHTLSLFHTVDKAHVAKWLTDESQCWILRIHYTAHPIILHI